MNMMQKGDFHCPVHFVEILNTLVLVIDYRCDDEKNSGVGAASWYHCIAEDSRIQKMPVINPLQAFVHPQIQKYYPAWIVNPQRQLLRIHHIWSINLQIRNCGLQSSKQLMS
jgi:hypothetical protein